MMFGRKILVLAGFGFVLGVLPARAQWAQGTLQRYTETQPYADLVAQTIARIPTVIFRRCPTLKYGAARFKVFVPATFGPSGAPVSGLWKEEIPISGCDNDTTLNLFFGPAADGKMHSVAAIPGETRTDLTLQRDAFTYAQADAAAAIKGCSSFLVRDSKFGGYGRVLPPARPAPDPGPGARFRPWWETWTLAGCGQTDQLVMQFIPDATGTQIVAHQKTAAK